MELNEQFQGFGCYVGVRRWPFDDAMAVGECCVVGCDECLGFNEEPFLGEESG